MIFEQCWPEVNDSFWPARPKIPEEFIPYPHPRPGQTRYKNYLARVLRAVVFFGASYIVLVACKTSLFVLTD